MTERPRGSVPKIKPTKVDGAGKPARDTRWRFVVDIAPKGQKRDQRTHTYDTKKEAQAELARVMSERATGTHIAQDKRLTVAGYLDAWLERKSKAGKKPATLRSYLDALKPVRDAHGTLPLYLLTAEHLEAIREDIQSGELRRIGKPGPLSARSVNVTLTVIRMALGDAVKRRLIAHNVAQVVDNAPSAPAGAARDAWETADAVAFLVSVTGDRFYAAWLMSLFGMRRGEVLGLRWEDVDLTGEQAKARRLPEGTPTLMIINNRTLVAGYTEPQEGTPKSKASARTLPLPETLVSALKALRAKQVKERMAAGPAYGNTGLVVVKEDGAPVLPRWYSDRFKALGKQAGRPELPLHGARHCAASLLGDLGMAIQDVAAWLGQSQISVTAGYQHAQMASLAEVSRVLGERLTGTV